MKHKRSTLPTSSLRERILQLVRDPSYRPVNEAGLTRLLQLDRKRRSSLLHEVRLLLRDGELSLVQGDRLRWRGPEGELTGTIQFRMHGQAIVKPDPSPDLPSEDLGPIWIEAGDTGTAFPGDRVAVRITGGSGRARKGTEDWRRGRVTRVIERARSSVVGTLGRAGKAFVLVPDDPRFPSIRLANPAQSPLTPPPVDGDKLVVTLDPWEDPSESPTGTIERRLGRQFEPTAELLGVYEKFSLEPRFPQDVDREAAGLPARVRPSELTGRRDFREIPTLTIDPEDAKDFDDALSIESLDNGQVRIGVHIADVSTYVRPGTALDREARSRGNSTYLVGTVIPMLPERLSNGLCSLVEGEDRLTMAALFTFDRAGRLHDTEFARTVIRSRKRLSYEQAQALLFESDLDRIRALPALPAHQTGATGRPLASLDDLELVDLQSWLRKLWAVARRLRAARMAAGSLNLDMPETKIFVDAKGYADRIERRVYNESHQLIEEFMLAANQAVARLTRSQRIPSLYRVHDDPDERKLDEYRQFAATLGLRAGNLAHREEMSALLEAAESHPQGYLLKSQLLRSLRKACYRASPDGHYGLAMKDYTHFTSPIRRYADLVVHRVLDTWLAKRGGEPGARPRTAPAGDRGSLEALAEHLSLTESNSQEAERESFRIKLLEFFERELTRRPRTRFAAIITEVRQNGLFIELTESTTFGFVPVSGMTDDFYTPDASGRALIGRRRHRRFTLASKIEVVVSAVDRFRRQMDFALAE
ncbi:ribonuclease R [mine drainage metagenome]|uniref:Ribonuclease R n=1 Tax=mine drainage metagenome TaxID=410659 RepID=A0A1J5TYQ3_9ZZZZ